MELTKHELSVVMLEKCVWQRCALRRMKQMLMTDLCLSIATRKTRCTSRYGRTTSLAFYELEYTNYVGNIIPHAITSLM